MMVVVDKAALDMHKNDVEMKRYIITYLKLVSLNFITLLGRLNIEVFM